MATKVLTGMQLIQDWQELKRNMHLLYAPLPPDLIIAIDEIKMWISQKEEEKAKK